MGILIVILLVGICFIISEICSKKKKKDNENKEKEIERYKNQCYKEVKDFIDEYKKDEILSKSFWFENASILLTHKNSYLSSSTFLCRSVDKRLSDQVEHLTSIVEQINRYNNEAADVKEKMLKNLETFKTLKDKGVPKFFVLKTTKLYSIGNSDISCSGEFYGFSNNATIDEDLNISGMMFFSNKKNGEYITISPYEYELTEMTKEEFNTKYLQPRLTVMCFDNDISASMYEDYLKTMYEYDK